MIVRNASATRPVRNRGPAFVLKGASYTPLETRRDAPYPAIRMRPPSAIGTLLLATLAALCPGLAAPARADLGTAWRALPPETAGDNLAPALVRLEAQPPAGVSAAAAAFALGQFHYARGEYRQAADAFQRAGGRVIGEDRGEARYWAGLSLLALGDPAGARNAFAEAERSSVARGALARLGLAQALELQHQPARALEAYSHLLAANPGEAGPAAFERYIALSEQARRFDDARRARERLAHDYPVSLEATRMASAQPPVPSAGTVAVQIGAFADRARADALAESARRAGFAAVHVRPRAAISAGQPAFIVRLGVYGSRAEAAAAGEKAARALGVAWQLTAP